MESDAVIEAFVEAVYAKVAAKIAEDRQVEEFPGVLCTKSAAAYLDMTLDAFKGMIKRDEVPVHRLPNKRLRFIPAELDALVT